MRQVLIPPHIDTAGPVLGGVVHALGGLTMGTSWSVKLVAGRTPPGPDWAQGIQRQLDTVVAQMSTWDPRSRLGRFNTAPAGSWHELPPEFFDVLSCALRVAHDSQGAYDPTAGALVNLWGFGPTRRFDEAGFEIPTAQAVDEAAACGGWQRLALDADRRRACQPGGMQLDLSAIAKGFAVDQVLRHLQARGIESCMVEVGGELRGIGVKPDGQPWWVALEHPEGEHSLPGTPARHGHLNETVLALHGISVATSGDYRRYFEIDGRRHAHTVDPRTGWPASHALASVSVVHADCMMADAWSTALTVMGVERGLAEADARGLAVRFVVRGIGSASTGGAGFTEHLSQPFAALLS
jgi:thiamine biosynthesis lipoprotein